MFTQGTHTPASTSSTSGNNCTSSTVATPVSTQPTSGAVTHTPSHTPSTPGSTCGAFSSVMIGGVTSSAAPKATTVATGTPVSGQTGAARSR